jgi:hypothetical protein
MILALSLILGLLPMAGIVWTVREGLITTVDGLFMSLILLSLSGIVFFNLALDFRIRHAAPVEPKKD